MVHRPFSLSRIACVIACVAIVTIAAAAPLAGDEVVVPVSADSWTHGLSSASTSGGTDDGLGICPSADYWIYLRFDLTGIDGRILDAELRMVRFDGSRPEEISVYGIDGDDWEEATLAGLNRPDPQSPAAAATLATGQEEQDFDSWSSAALVEFVAAEFERDGMVSLMVREDPDDRLDVRRYFSREGARDVDETPLLVLDVEPPADETVAEGWQVSTVGAGTKPAFDFGPDGAVHVMWMTETFGGEVGYFRGESTTGPWEPTPIARGYFYGPGDLIVDAAGRAHLAWHDHDTEDASHAVVETDGSVTRFGIVTPGSHNGWDNALALDSAGVLHQSSVDPSGFGASMSLEVGAFDGAGWTYGTVTESGAFMYGLGTSIGLDRRDTPHIVFCQSFDWIADGELRHASRTENGWGISTIASGTGVGRFPSLALDHWDRPHVAWLDVDPRSETLGTVRYGVLNNDAWEIETIDTLESVRMGFSDARKSVSLVLDGGWRPHVAFADERRVVYATKPFDTWEITTVLEHPRETYKGLAVLRLDDSDRPAIVFWERDVATAGTVRLASRIAAPPGRSRFHRGDPDDSGTIEITDGVAIFGFLFLGGDEPGCREAADVNNDARLDISDGVAILNYLFTGGVEPAAPGPPPAPCGEDPDEEGSAGDLGCELYENC